LPVFVEDCVGVLDQQSQADGAHFMLVLKLHVQLDRVAAKSDVIWRIGVVSEGQIEAKLPGVEFDRALDIPRADNRMSFPEHGRLQKTLSHRRQRTLPFCKTEM
jgi:hypothetical protein